METAKNSKPFDEGDELYQQRAKLVLPILIRQARAKKPIFYSDLAEEVGMPNPRNLNNVLGSIGQTLNKLSINWNQEILSIQKIPSIQTLVINKKDKLPGEGISGFFTEFDYNNASNDEKRNYVQFVHNEIFRFKSWIKILHHFNLKELQMENKILLERASKFYAGGESESHKALKTYILNNPQVVSKDFKNFKTESEFKLPSGDKIDVLLESKKAIIAVEVKSSLSDDSDIVRGLFQCVKYKAVLEAVVSYEQRDAEVDAYLILESEFPSNLIIYKNTLGVNVKDNIVPK